MALRLFFADHEVTDHEIIQARSVKGLDGVFRRAYDRVALEVERCVHQHRRPCQLLELFQQGVITRVGFTRYGLNPTTIVHVDHRRDLMRARFVRPEAQDHVGRRFKVLEVAAGFLDQDAWSEWPPVFAEFHGVVHTVAVFYKTGVGQNRSATQGAWAEFHPPLEPADQTVLGQQLRRAARYVGLPAVWDFIHLKNALDLFVAEFQP